MKQYAYGFAWIDKDKGAQKVFIEAASRADATIEFESTYGMNTLSDNVEMIRRSW